jgi:pimeloyl-ACP methyl ester carboxylesterase
MAVFREKFVEADGFRIRYWEAGAGPALVHLHGGGGPALTEAHRLLARSFRVIAFHIPGFGGGPVNDRTRDLPELAGTLAAAARGLGLERFALMGSSFGGKVSVWMAALFPDLVSALVLDAPAAIRPEGMTPPSGTREEIAARLYAYPERMPPLPVVDPAAAAQTVAFMKRMRGPDRDEAVLARFGDVVAPVLAVFGSRDTVIPPELGREYQARMPNAHLVFVYDAAHMMMAERPEAFAEVVGDFLSRGEAFVIRREGSVVLG